MLLLAAVTVVGCGGDSSRTSSPSQHVFDEAGLFRRSPEKLEALENQMRTMAEGKNFHMMLVISKHLYDEDISVACRKLCTSKIGDRSGCMMLFEESSLHFHLSSPLTTGVPRVERGKPYVSSPWLEDIFLVISRDVAVATPEIQPVDYVRQVTERLLKEVNAQVGDGDRSGYRLWPWMMALALPVILGGIMVVRKSKRLEEQYHVEIQYPAGIEASGRMDARCGATLKSLAWSGAPEAVDGVSEDFFLRTPQLPDRRRKSLVGKAMIKELLLRLRDGEMQEDEICETYGITPVMLEKWQAQYADLMERPEADTKTLMEEMLRSLTEMMEEKLATKQEDEYEADSALEKQLSQMRTVLSQVKSEVEILHKLRVDETERYESQQETEIAEHHDEKIETARKQLPTMPI